MVGHGGSSASSYLANPTSPILSHCASIVATSTVRDMFEPRKLVGHFYSRSKVEILFSPQTISSERELSHYCLTQYSFRSVVK